MREQPLDSADKKVMVREPIILASRSPRRQELLQQIGVDFELLDLEIDEQAFLNEKPLDYVQRMALQKAQAGWALYCSRICDSQSDKNINQLSEKLNPEKLISKALLAADTCVVLEDAILGKPTNTSEAIEMLSALSGSQHQVMTSVALINAKGIGSKTSITQVEFSELSTTQIQDYCLSGECMDKAGSYAIQGLAAKFVKSIGGSYSGVVGLPLYETGLLLEQHFKVEL